MFIYIYSFTSSRVQANLQLIHPYVITFDKLIVKITKSTVDGIVMAII